MTVEIEKTLISLDQKICEVKWSDKHISRFHSKWLRFNCRCPRCRPKITAEYLVDIPSFPEQMLIKKVTVSKQELRIEFEEEPFPNHVTIYPLDWLRSKCYCEECLRLKVKQHDVIYQNIDLHKNDEKVLPKVDYIEIINNQDQGIFNVLKQLIERGACVIKHVPSEDGISKKIADLICAAEYTTYGETWDVISKDSENAAYTTKKLPLHQDQCQYETCPGVQILHALRFDECVEGGESIVVDGYEAVKTLREESPKDFQTLVEVPAVFFTIDSNRPIPVHYVHQKHHIVLDYFGEVVGLNWHPALMAPPQIHEKDVERYYDATVKMFEILRRKENQFRFRLHTGDMLIFNNRRMLHAREEFKINGGQRHLQGHYLRLDEVKSKYMVLAKKLNIDVVLPKVGNNSCV